MQLAPRAPRFTVLGASPLASAKEFQARGIQHDIRRPFDQSRMDLGRLFRIEDYPSKETLQGKFAIRYRIVPVPDADHFRAKLASGDTDRR